MHFGICEFGGAKSKKTGSVLTIHTEDSQARRQSIKASKSMMSVAASGSDELKDECAREECGSAGMEVRHDGSRRARAVPRCTVCVQFLGKC